MLVSGKIEERGGGKLTELNSVDSSIQDTVSSIWPAFFVGSPEEILREVQLLAGIVWPPGSEQTQAACPFARPS